MSTDMQFINQDANEINCNFIFLDYNSNLVVHNLLQASELEKLANQSRQLCNGSILTRVKLRVTPLHTWQGTVYFLLT